MTRSGTERGKLHDMNLQIESEEVRRLLPELHVYNNGIIRQSISDSLFGDIYGTDSTISISIRQTVLPRR
ncbi:hypothetical protein DW986_10785 [Parabacteroides merdae]|uniref:Uncharacterized protein n=1 Tax=Parabacteroides merdae TaxID=46503 RepID=A0A3R5ZND2_9BACT|nr:hypothetical protein DW986_10785 [Parabacteroides merdae]RHH78549.1 hypothetical protein DW191_07720 [Parabacteroides merdae]